jgi:Domain of unknown function (DUF4307)
VTTPGEPRRPEGRYDEQRPPNRWFVIIGAALFGVGVTFGVVRLYDDFGGRVDVAVQRMVIADRSVTLEFDVVKQTDRAAQCYLRAQDVDRNLLGELRVLVPAGKRTTRLTEVVETTRRANLGEVLRCQLLPEGTTTLPPAP